MDDDIQAIIFDAGGVLTTSPGAYLASVAAAHDISIEQFLEIAIGPLDRDSDHPWHAVERGQMSLDDFDAAIEPQWRAAGLSSFPPTPRDFVGMVEPVPEMLETVAALRRAGYQTAILSNGIREWSRWRQIVNADELVDVVVDSSDVGLRKPDPAIYRLTVTRLGVEAERCLYLDDFPWNLPPAAELGMQTRHVTDPLAAATELRTTFGL